MSKKLLYIIMVVLLSFKGIDVNAQDTTVLNNFLKCNFEAIDLETKYVDYPRHGATAALTAPGSFPAAAIDTCGKFRVFYADQEIYLATGTVRGGFADATWGATRRNTLCAVLNYIQSRIDFSKIHTGEYLRLYIDTSASTSFPATTPTMFSTVAVGYPFFPPFSLGDTVNGFAYDYITSGSDPNSGDYHAYLKMNFDKGYYGATGYPETLPWNNGLSVPNCDEFDLYSVLLHFVTHDLGWFSWSDSYHTTTTVAGVYSNFDMALYKTPWMAINSNPFASIEKVYPSTSTYTADYWANSKLPPDNYYVSGGHFDVSYYSGRVSPGETQNFVMGFSFPTGGTKREYLRGDWETLHNGVGYDYNSSFETDSAVVIANHVPFSQKMGSDTLNKLYYNGGVPEGTPRDYIITNDVGTSLTINLNSLSDLKDADGDIISIYPNSVINFRGCSNGSNNHKQLSLSNGNKTITYTPRANFYGRAQFGFNLYDGKEKGGFVLFTVDVRKGNNVSIATGDNLLLNGDFEEGSEVRTDDTNQNINNGFYQRMSLSQHMSDSHPNDYSNSHFGTAIRNAVKICTTTPSRLYYFGHDWCTLDFSAPFFGATYTVPNPYLGVGNRYQPVSLRAVNFYLGDTLKKCQRYVLEFDALRTLSADSSVLPYPAFDSIVIGFGTDTFFSATLGNHPIVTMKPYPTDKNKRGIWTHFKIPFSYCRDTTASIMSLFIKGLNGLAPAQVIDNVVLAASSEPFSFTLSDSSIGRCSTRLYSDHYDLGCSSSSYKWRKLGDTTVIATTATLDITNNLERSYTLSIYDGCSSSIDTITIAPCPCSVGALFGATIDSILPSTLSTSLSTGFYHLTSDLNVSSSLSLSGAKILIEPDVKITVSSSAKLTINNSHLFTCPDTNKLWKGITLNSAANIEVLNNTLIEDAETAITAASPALASGSSYIIKTQDVVFNRNRQGIAISNYTPTSPSVYPFQIANTVFTSRDLSTFSGYPTTWASTAALGSTFSNTAATAPYALCRDYSPMMLKNGIEPLVGIKLSDVGTLSGASYPYIQIGMVTTPNDANLFDNVGDGINALNSNFTVHNAAFANNKPAPLGSRTIGLAYAVGTGIYADKGYQRRADISYAAAVNYDLYVKFYDCASGIKLNSYSISNIYRNNVYSSNTDPNAKIRGVDVTLSRYDSCIINGNFLYNIPTGIYLYSSTASGGYRLGRSRISNNTIQPELPSPVSTTGTESVLQGIDVSAALFSSSGVVTDKVQVTGNTLNRVYNGIKVSNYNMQKVLTMTNSITMKYQSAAAVQYGVYANNNYDALVYGNTVSGIGTVTNDPRKRAFYSASNRILAIQCNSSSHTGIGFDFSGIQPQSFWWHNTMLDHVNGMAIGGPIDQQGNGTQATLNEWNGSWLGTNYQTLCYGSTDPSLSPMYVKNNSLQNPSNNSSYPPGPTIPKYPDAGSIVTTTYAVYDPCAPSTSFEPRAIGGLLPHLIKAGNVDYGTDNDVNAWLGQMSLWRIIHSDDSFNYFSNNDFVDFAAMADTARFGWLTSIEDALGEGDTNTAQSLLASPVAAKGYVYVSQNLMLTDVSAADYIVDNYTQFYTLYLDYLKGEAVDSSLLASLCFKCPRLEGDVVHQARSFYTQLYGATEVYNDDSLCAIGNTQRVLPDPSIDIAGSDAVTANYTLFPNPNSGNFVIKQKYAQNKRVYLKVYNAIGALVYQGEAVFSNGQASVVIGDKAAGVYLVCFGDEKDKTICLRFTVK